MTKNNPLEEYHHKYAKKIVDREKFNEFNRNLPEASCNFKTEIRDLLVDPKYQKLYLDFQERLPNIPDVEILTALVMHRNATFSLHSRSKHYHKRTSIGLGRAYDLLTGKEKLSKHYNKFEAGGTVGETGLALVHAGELVIPANTVRTFSGSKGLRLKKTIDKLSGFLSIAGLITPILEPISMLMEPTSMVFEKIGGMFAVRLAPVLPTLIEALEPFETLLFQHLMPIIKEPLMNSVKILQPLVSILTSNSEDLSTDFGSLLQGICSMGTWVCGVIDFFTFGTARASEQWNSTMGSSSVSSTSRNTIIPEKMHSLEGSFASGGHVEKTGAYLLHQGEYVIPNSGSKNIIVNVNGNILSYEMLDEVIYEIKNKIKRSI